MVKDNATHSNVRNNDQKHSAYGDGHTSWMCRFKTVHRDW